MISSWGTGWCCGRFPTSTISTSGESSSITAVGPSRSVTTTSASASRRRPRTVIRSTGPGPPPTRCTRPTGLGRLRRNGRLPSRSFSAIAVRSSRVRPGSTPASDTTPTMLSPERVSAARRAEPWLPSPALMHRTHRTSHSAATSASTRGSPVAVCTSHASSRSPGTIPRARHSRSWSVTRRRAVAPSSGATTRTTAPSSRKRRMRRAATSPPPTITTCRPVREMPIIVVMSPPSI